MRPVFNKHAIFSDTSEDYVTPVEPEPYGKVTIRIRTEKNNVDYVFCVLDQEKELMTKSETEDLFDYYEINIQLENQNIKYYFEIKVGKISCFYDQRGISKEIEDNYKFELSPGFKTPEWAKGAVMYQIYIDRFYNGDLSNDVLSKEYHYLGDYSQRVEDWNKYPDQMGIREFYGGDLQGVLDKLDYIQGLGVEVIYFNPLFVSPSNHKYDIQDYDYIDPHIGVIVSEKGDVLQDGQTENRFATRYINRVTNKENLEASNAFFAKVVEAIHARGMKVILDGVFNHCGSFNKWLDKERIYEKEEDYPPGAYIAKESPYYNYFSFNAVGNWPYNNAYDGWWGHDTLPKLNFEKSRELYQYILEVGRKWVSPPYNVDGWRLDVAADLGHSPELNHQFWRDFRRTVKEANPNAIILAEHYGNPREWLNGDQWDTVMNYDAFMEPITWFLTGMQKHSDDYRSDMFGNADSLKGALIHHSTNFMNSSLQVAMNELSNHDHSRFLTRTNKKVGRMNTIGQEAAEYGVNKAVFREAVVMQMTWIGAPTIYYGDEAGLCGFTDPDNRRTYPWGREDLELIQFHREMIRIHKENKSFRKGSVKFLYSEFNILAYGRFDRKNQALVILNNNEEEKILEFSVWEIGIAKESIMEQLILTTADGYTTELKEYSIEAGKIKVILPKLSALVLRSKKEPIEEKQTI